MTGHGRLEDRKEGKGHNCENCGTTEKFIRRGSLALTNNKQLSLRDIYLYIYINMKKNYIYMDIYNCRFLLSQKISTRQINKAN